MWVIDLVLVAAGAVGGGAATATGVGYAVRRFLTSRRKTLPSLPSFEEAVADPDEAVRAHAAAHDVVMMVTEAFNAAQSRGLSIEEALDRPALSARCAELRAAVADLRRALTGWSDLVVQVARCEAALEALWVHTADDRYTTTIVPVVIPTGKSVSVSMQPQQQYIGTDHTFVWHEAAFVPARTALDQLRRQVGELEAPPVLGQARVELALLAPDVRSLAERLVRHSVRRASRELEADQVEQAANQWLAGAAFDERMRAGFDAIRAAVGAAEEALRATRASPARTERRTMSSTDPGPEGYQLVKALLGHLAEGKRQQQAIERSLDAAVTMADEVERWASDSRVIEADRTYLRRVVASYKLLFPRSELRIDVPAHPAWAWVATLFAAGLGAGIGATAGSGLAGLVALLLSLM